MADRDDIEARLAAVEARVEKVATDQHQAVARIEAVAADAAAARHLAAARDRDLADLGVKVDANRRAINALGEQTRARFDHLEGRFGHLEGRFDRLEREMRHGFAVSAAGHQQIIALLTGPIEGEGDA